MAFWFFGLPAIQDDYSYELRGRVTDEVGRPVAGALVFLDPFKEDDQVFGFTTDGDGTFHIRETQRCLAQAGFCTLRALFLAIVWN